jgi:PAS domain S-box-containing protein
MKYSNLIKILLILIFSSLNINHIFAQNNNKIDSNNFELLIKKAELNSEIKPKLSLEYSLLAYKIALRDNDNKKELKSLKLIARAYYNLGNNQNALKYYNLALSISIQEKDKISEIEIINKIGVLYRILGSLHLSLEKHIKALELSNQIPDPDTLKVQIFNDLGVLYRNFNDNEKAMLSYKEALNLSFKRNYLKGQGIAYKNIGNLMFYSKNYDSAIVYYNKALQVYSDKNIPLYFKSGILNNIGNVNRMKKDFKTALKYYNLALEISLDIEDKNLEAIIYKNIATTYKNKEDYNLAKDYFFKSINIAKEIDLKRVLIESYYELSDLYEKTNELKNSLEYYKLFSLLKDSVYDNERNIHIAELEMRYNKKQQEETINILKLKRQQTHIIYLSVLSLFLIILLYVNYKRLKLKKSDNKLISEQKAILESLNKELKEKNFELEKHKLQLIESEQLYRMIFENSPLGNALIDSKGDFQKINNALLKIFGLVNDKEIISKNLFDFSILKRTNILIDFEKVISENKVCTGEIQIKSLNGNKVVIYYHLYPIVDDKGKVSKVQAIAIDITDKYLKDKAINLKNIELQEMNATKDRFFSIIAHDLKNPFNAVMGFANLLRDDYDSYSDEEKKQFIESIALASEDINNLLENLLKWAWSQSGKIEYNPEKINAIDIINECIDLVKVQADKKKITLNKLNADSVYIYVDANMIRTVIRNLLSNAIKYTPSEGSVKVNYMTKQLASENGNSDVMEIAISDTGVGISKEDIDKIFKIGSRVKKLGTEGETGTGLGLILCKEFVQKNGGNIYVDSTLGKGSTFVFTVPLYSEKNELKTKVVLN